MPLIKLTSPSSSSLIPVANVRLPPPLSPATTILSASIPSALALRLTHLSPETQALRPAGNGAISGADDGRRALRKSTIATATPRAAKTGRARRREKGRQEEENW